MLARVTDPRFRTFWPRVAAAILDAFVVMVPLSIMDWMVWTLVSSPPVLAGWYVVVSFAFVAYTISFHARTGQTIGKRIARVRVFTTAEAPLTLRHAVLRDVVPLLAVCWVTVKDLPTVLTGTNPADRIGEPTDLAPVEVFLGSVVIVWGVLELLTMLTNSRRRSIHDFIAGTVVMRVSPDGQARPGHPEAA